MAYLLDYMKSPRLCSSCSFRKLKASSPRFKHSSAASLLQLVEIHCMMHFSADAVTYMVSVSLSVVVLGFSDL